MYLVNLYGPFIAFIIIGYLLARFGNISASSPYMLVRYLFLPAIVFTALSSRVSPKTIVLVILTGAGVAVLGGMIISKLSNHIKISGSGGDGTPNVAYFTLPLLGFCFGAKGLATACFFLIGVYISQEGKKGSSLDFKKIIKEPLVLAAIAALIVSYARLRIPFISKVINPLYKSSFLMIAIYLGATFHPLNKLRGLDNVFPICIRLASGFFVASLVISLFSFKGIIAKTIMLCALAPPGAAIGSSGAQNGDSDNLGIIICLILMIIMTNYGWRPWNFRLF